MSRNWLLRSLRSPVIIIGIGFAIRLGIDFVLSQDGYFYGVSPDTFARTNLSWEWSKEAFFNTSRTLPFTWMPLQIWINGIVFYLLRSFINTASVIVPVVTNHLFFLGTLSISYFMANRIGGWASAICCVALALTMRSDIWVTFTGLSEPITILLGVCFAYIFFRAIQNTNSSEMMWFWMSLVVFLISANHYVGWSFSVFFLTVILIFRIRGIETIGFRGKRRGWLIGIVIALGIPTGWLGWNFVQAGNPLEFLLQAQDFHAQYFLLDPWYTRLFGLFGQVWRSEPLIVLLLIPSIIYFARNQPVFLAYVAPGITYILFLVISSLAGWSLAYRDSHPRYVLLLFWLGLPLLSSFVVQIARSKIPGFRMGAIAFLLVLPVIGIFRAFKYVNWVSDDTRETAAYLGSWLGINSESREVIVEDRGWDNQAIDVVSGSPERFRFKSRSEIEEDFMRGDFNGEIIYVITDVDTIRDIEPFVMFQASFGDYVLLSPGAESGYSNYMSPSSLIWNPINLDQHLLIIPPDRVVFGYSNDTFSEVKEVGIFVLLEMEPNGCYILEGEVKDHAEIDSYPWTFLQQLVVNNLVLWSHDIAADGFSGWQTVRYYVMATSDQVEIKF